MKVKDLVRRFKSGPHIDSYSKFGAKDKELNEVFYETRAAVHAALCGRVGLVSMQA